MAEQGILLPQSSKKYKFWCMIHEWNVDFIMCYFDEYIIDSGSYGKYFSFKGEKELFKLTTSGMGSCRQFVEFKGNPINANVPNWEICFWDDTIIGQTSDYNGKWVSEDLKQWFDKRVPNCPLIDPQKPETPTPEGGEGGQTDKTCSNAGQFGGGGTPLKDIKLFLYANKVTKGTIKLSKPQVEAGTFATDWRPNPSDYVERHSPAYKEVKGIAIQHNQSQNKKYLEIETADGGAYGVDLWGGDAKKILEQQQAEIEELKKLVKTLELRINV